MVPKLIKYSGQCCTALIQLDVTSCFIEPADRTAPKGLNLLKFTYLYHFECYLYVLIKISETYFVKNGTRLNCEKAKTKLRSQKNFAESFSRSV